MRLSAFDERGGGVGEIRDAELEARGPFVLRRELAADITSVDRFAEHRRLPQRERLEPRELARVAPASLPVALYGVVLLFAAIAYFILTRALLLIHDADSKLAIALGADFKGKISMLIYLLAIPLAFVRPWIACSLYIMVEVTWLVPDRRIERTIGT